jgi:nucleoside-diphosphate-sugar epimerase
MKAHAVSGADGFIGSTLVERLVRNGKNVRALAYYNSFGTNGWLDSLPKEILSEGASSVYHLAALIGVPYSFECPNSYIDTNVYGTMNMLNSCRENRDLDSIIITSTSETYGTAQSVPIKESHRIYAQSPYAASKVAADQLSISYFNSFEMPVKVIRPFNTFGPRQSLRAVIPTIISQLQQRCGRLKLGDLSTSRDFTFVEDTADAFLALDECSAGAGEQLNVSSGFEITIGDLVNLLCRQIGHFPDIEQDLSRMRPGTSEVKRLLGDSARFRSLTGWRPSYEGKDGFERAIEKTIQWFDDQSEISAKAREYYV